MSVELLYTSAPKGLKQGSRGFCTVLSTEGMPINIASRLESLSGYRQLYPPDSPQAGQNPVAYSHLRMTAAGKQWSVLSRITAFGTDYTGRTNKIAHHVVPDESEQGAAGPAWIMMQPGVMRSTWSGQCETPEKGPRIPSEDQQAGLCSTWKSVAGDAGWGGVVAEIFEQTHKPPTWLIYRADQQGLVLPLINEAIALLPTQQRWKATFSTYATNIPPDVDCKLRCVLDGTEEARFASVKPNVIDMTKPMSLPTENTLTDQARGKAPKPVDLPLPTERLEIKHDEAKPLVSEINLDDEADVHIPRHLPPAMTPQNTGVQPPPIRPPKSENSASTSDGESDDKPKRSFLLPILSVLFVTIVGVLTWFIADHVVGASETEYSVTAITADQQDSAKLKKTTDRSNLDLDMAVDDLSPPTPSVCFRMKEDSDQRNLRNEKVIPDGVDTRRPVTIGASNIGRHQIHAARLKSATLPARITISDRKLVAVRFCIANSVAWNACPNVGRLAVISRAELSKTQSKSRVPGSHSGESHGVSTDGQNVRRVESDRRFALVLWCTD